MILKKGSKGDKVRQLQLALGITSDGIFGSATESAVKKFQKEHGLFADGIVGPKTMDMLSEQKLDSDVSDKLIITPSIQIENYYLPKGQYLEGHYNNDYIILHHTAGWDNPKGVVDCWAHDSIGRVATEFVVGGQRTTDGRKTYDGQIIRTYPEGCQGYHIGKCGSSYMTTHSVGIEICNMGQIKNGKTYVNTPCIESQMVTLKEPFRGYKTYHKYSDASLKATHDLLLYIANRDNIDLHKGLYQWIKKDGAKAFDFQSDAYYGKVKGGMMTHANIRKDKNDLFPQDEVMDMILSL